jgi:hypothetical protein
LVEELDEVPEGARSPEERAFLGNLTRSAVTFLPAL